ncbi:amino acid adenylation domain-containing protein, partial [Andreprevotia lacus DSM 23236]
IDYLGRSDQQVKLRGFRIELGEIEATLLQQPAIRDAVVVARQADEDTRLVAYLVAQPEQAMPDGDALRSILLRSLPDYMVPAYFIELEQLPLTPNGKVDRQALPAPQREVDEDRYVAPRTETEARLAQIWAGVLKLDRVGVHDNFFALGGHSLLAVALIDAMRQAGLPAEVRSIFTHPTVATMVQALGDTVPALQIPPNLIPAGCNCITPDMLPLIDLAQSAIDAIAASVPGGMANIQDIYPLAPLQEGMLFHHLLDEAGDAYLAQLQFAFASRALLDSFIAALQTVIARHDILRTAVHWQELAEPVQVVLRTASLPVEWLVLAPDDGDIAVQLGTRYDPRSYRLNVSHAPMMQAFVAEDTEHGRWVLHLLQHHLIDDNLTLQLLFDEVRRIMQGEQDQLPQALPFRDFIAQTRLGTSNAEHEAFFCHMLADVDETTAPFGVVDVLGDGSDVSETRHALPRALSLRLREQARNHLVNTASLMHLAWALVLARLAGRDDVVFGTVLFGRMQGGGEAGRMMGPCINTLPLRLNVGNISLRDALVGTHDMLVQLLQHEHAPLSLAQRCSGIAAPQPLFTSLINCRRVQAETNSHTLDGCEIILAEERTNLPFVLSVDDVGDDLVLTAQIGAGIPAQRIHDYMHAALAGIADGLQRDAGMRIVTLNVLPEYELQQRRSRTTTRSFALSDTATLITGFEAQAARTPENTAIAYGADTLSYAALNRQANRLAHQLRASGVGPDVLVGLCAERSPELLVGLLAILKAGGAYLPLDPAYPQERLAYMLADAQPRLVLTQTAVRDVLPAETNIINLDDAASASDGNAENPAQLNGPDHLAYVIYTSGSTGKPKGALLPHRNVLRLFAATEQWFGFNENDVWTLFHSFAFDFSVWEIWGAWLHGGKLVVVPQETARDPAQHHALLLQQGVTVLNQTPSAFQQLVQLNAAPLPALRYVIFGGEALNHAALAPWFARHGDKQPALVNMYGITETTVHVTYQPLTQHGQQAAAVGIAIPDLAAHLLDAHLNPVPTGVAGELYIAGTGLARGYLGRAELTAERFIPDPFSGTGGRLYRTGDLARYLPDGTLEYLGRIDHQVKLRGFRIELGEIEAALAAQPAIRETLVLLREDMPGDARLVAYLTAEHVIEPDLLRKHLRQNLPDYMLPAHFVQLDQFPLTENGKINRKALPAPERSSTDSTAPRNEREARLAEIWAAVLRLEQIGIHDNFFALGGHSLLAVTLVDQLRKAGWQCDVRTLFAAPTIADLAALLADAREMAADVVVPPNLITAGAEHITPDMLPLATLGQADIERIIASTPGGVANVQDIYPMAPLQQGMLFHYQLETQGDAYLVKFQFAFADRARLDTFLAALQQVINRHDILRTAIVWQSLDEAMQVVWRNATLPVELATLDATDGDIAVQLDQRYDPRRVRLDLSQAPLMRAVIAQDEAQHRWVLHLLQHHMIDDNLTMQWLFAEIAQIINGQQAQLPPAQPFRNFIAQARFGASAAEHEAFFARTLGHIDTPTAPYDITEVHGDGSDVDDARLILPGALSQRIMQSARTHKVSSAVLMHLAWALVLARTTGRREVVFGTVLFGRMQGSDGADRIMGPCINTLPLCLRIDHADAATALQATQQALAGLMQHEHAPLAMAQRASGVEPPLPLFTALLNCRRTRGTAEQQPPMDGMSFIGMQERTNLPFVMAVDEWGDDFMLSAQTGAGIPAQRLCDYMQLALERLLDALATGAPLSRMDLLPAAERQLQLLDWNRTAADYPALPIHTLFAQQARQHPNDIAAEFAGSSLSYAELDRQANQLAHALLAQGVGAESLVGICAERSFEVLIGTLAILKAGAAYLPLDPGLPVQRLRYLLDDAAPALVLAAGPAWPALGLDDVPQLALEPASWQGQPIGAPAVVVYPDQLAYVMYTSGSTGQPKGVAVSHRNVVRLVRGATYYDLPTGGRILHVAAMTFDASTFEWWAPLLNGGRVAIAPAGRLTLAQLGNCIAGQDITLFLTTALFHQLVEHELPQLLQARQVLTGGEALSPAHANTFIAAGGRLVNCYGPTECTTYSTTHPMHGDVPSRIPIGRPIANAQMYVLDTQLNPVPQGVAGELYIGGDGLARGYLNRPELTAERFIPNPFGPTGTRLYRTGDLVRYLPNGDLDYLRRADQQVKLRGFRIELGEIEAALFALPGISSAAVLAREDEPGDKRLVAYWVAEAGSELTDADLRAQLQLQLPDYMVPARYMQLDSLPLMLNGKVDRKALPAPQQLASETDSYVAPRTETEAKLAAIWAEVLKLDRVGVDDNFFALGGHSLLATQIMSRTRREFGVDIPLAVIFETPTVAALAQRYDELQTLLRTDVLHEDDDLEEVEY